MEKQNVWWLPKWQDVSKYDPDDDQFRWEVEGIREIVKTERKALLKRIGEEVEKKEHTLQADSYCYTCKEVGCNYNLALGDIKNILK